MGYWLGIRLLRLGAWVLPQDRLPPPTWRLTIGARNKLVTVARRSIAARQQRGPHHEEQQQQGAG